MKLGTFSISLPVFVVESEVTYQTVRSPSVFERMIMRLCGRYGNAPGIGDMTLLRIFEDKLGVASAIELVGPSVENLVHLGVVSSTASKDIMFSQLSQVQLTAEGRDFLERDRLPSQSKQVSVKHLFLPLLNAVKANRLDPRFSRTPSHPNVDAAVLQPADCSHLVRETLTGEQHPWKTANTELRHVESRMAGVLWEQHQIVIECDPSGVLSVSSASSPELDRWLANVQPDVLWKELLERLFYVDPLARWPDLGPHPLVGAIGISLVTPAATEPAGSTAPAEVVLRVLGDAALLARYPDADVVVLSAGTRGLGRLSSKEATLAIEVPAPSTLPAGFECLTLMQHSLAPTLTCAGLVKVIWAGRERQAALRVRGDSGTASQVWSAVRGVLSAAVQDGVDADVLALAAIWEPLSETMARWCLRAETLPLGDLLREAATFAQALSRFAAPSRTQWGAEWHEALAVRLHRAVARVDGGIAVEVLLEWLKAMDRLVGVRARSLVAPLLAYCATTDDIDAVRRLRQSAGPTIDLPNGLFGDGVILQWIAGALTDEVAPTFGPHPFAEPIERLRSAYRSVSRDIGLKSLDDAGNGTLSLKGVKTSAVASASRWQSAIATLTDLRPSLPHKWPDRLVVLDRKVAAWRELANRRLAPPAPAGQRLVVLDSNALMDRPDFLLEMLRTDVPIVPRRVLEELDGLKGSTDEETAGKARAAIRALERAGQVVRYETEVLDLLPPDWGASPDNRILSVALHLRLSDVVVVTGDRNLRNKARAEDIPAMLPEEYARQRPGQSDSGDLRRGRR